MIGTGTSVLCRSKYLFGTRHEYFSQVPTPEQHIIRNWLFWPLEVGKHPVRVWLLSKADLESGDISHRWIQAFDDRVDLTDMETLRQAGAWLERCCAEHTQCHTSALIRDVADLPSLGPHRLLEVQYSLQDRKYISLRLVSTRKFRSLPIYLALSYCWGGPQKCMTDSKNLNERLSGFSLDHLDGTIKHAVELARLLQVPYLWVDALCIVQDDEKDKMQEIALMEDVYGQALATVVVEATPCASQGFLKIYNNRKKWNLPYLCPDKTWGNVVIDEVFTGPSESGKRAWMLQESVLSTRQIVFGSDSISWRCKESFQYSIESRLAPTYVEDAVNVYINWPISNGLSLDNVPGRPMIEDRKAATKWLDLLENYTRRQVTVEQDRLLAIAGLASRVKRGTTLTYVAGLWLEGLSLGLLWVVEYEEIMDERSPSLPRRASGYVAPSWSWASVTSRCSWQLPKSDSQILVRIDEYHLDFLDKDDCFSKLLGGWLKATGKLVPCDFLADKARSYLPTFRAGDMFQIDWFSTYPDALESMDAMCGETFLLCLVEINAQESAEVLHLLDDQRQKYKGAISILEASIWEARKRDGIPIRQYYATGHVLRVRGVVLQPISGKPDTFRRVGYWTSPMQRWTMDLLNDQQVTII